MIRNLRPPPGAMCYIVECGKCKKKSYGGCGMHVEAVFRDVPVEQRCFCGFTEEERRAAEKAPHLRSSMPKGGGGCALY